LQFTLQAASPETFGYTLGQCVTILLLTVININYYSGKLFMQKMAVKYFFQVEVFWIEMLYSVVVGYQRFRGHPENGGSMDV
jgi:hypothetical protein